VVQISPPLVAGQAEFDEMVGILGDVLAEAGDKVHESPVREGEPTRLRSDLS
jgi:hypothetical protein